MQHISGMDRARIALEKGDRLPVGTLQSTVADSWQRCRDGNLDPRGTPRHSVVAFSDVKHRREANAAMRLLALAEMQLLHSQIAGSNFMIALGDANGIVLDTISDPHFADSEAGRSIIPDSVWDETQRGTNALGLAAMAGKPVAIYGREHYFACHRHLSCMAPISNSAGEVLGLLDASCANEARQEHTHALVRMAAAQIQNGLIYQDAAKSFVFAFHPRVEYLDTLSAGQISVGLDGEVLSVNRPGKALLHCLPMLSGNHFDSLSEAGFGLAVDGLLKGGVIRIRDRAGSGVFMVCRQIGERQTTIARRASPSIPALIRTKDAPDFVSDDSALKQSLGDLAEASALRMPVHITGETGTGKELMARHVHRLSGRKGEFVAVNCGAVAEGLFIAEIFGHERGAFTNARAEGSPGLARAADRGTLFLDEVADIPLAAQTALLRFLDSMEIRAVGAQRAQKVDVQIVSATNRDLEDMIAQRLFRADLYYRLNAFTIRLPALRNRTDFAGVVRHLMESLAPGTPVTDAAISLLSKRGWPGNIRELKTVLQRALLRSRSEYIDEGSFDDARAVTRCLPDCCDDCRSRPLSRAKCQEIRLVYRKTDDDISQTATARALPHDGLQTCSRNVLWVAARTRSLFDFEAIRIASSVREKLEPRCDLHPHQSGYDAAYDCGRELSRTSTDRVDLRFDRLQSYKKSAAIGVCRRHPSLDDIRVSSMHRRNPKVFAQRPPFIIRAKQPASSKLRQHHCHKVLETGRKQRRHDIEAISSAGNKAFFHCIGDLRRGTDHLPVATGAGEMPGEIADRQIIALSKVDDQLLAALDAVGRWHLGQWTIERISGQVLQAEIAGKQCHADGVGYEILQRPVFRPRLVLSRTDNRRNAWHNLDVVGMAAIFADSGFYIDIIGACLLGRLRCGKNHVGGPCSQLLADRGGTGLNHDRPTLWRARTFENAVEAKMRTSMVGGVELARIAETPRSAVRHIGTLLDTIPEREYRIGEFLRPLVTLGMGPQATAGEILGLQFTGRGDQVPSCPTTAQLIERCESAGQAVRFIIGRRRRGHEADMRGVDGKCGQQAERLEGRRACRLARHLGIALADRCCILDEQHVEFAAFGDLSQGDEMIDVDACGGMRIGMAPGSDMVAAGHQKGTEPHLTIVVHDARSRLPAG